jgi:hypothetical protein
MFDWLFGRKEDDGGHAEKVRRLEEKLHRLEKENDAFSQWIRYLHEQHQHHRRKLEDHEFKLSRHPNRAEITGLIAQSGTVSEIAARLRRIEEQVRDGELRKSLKSETKPVLAVPPAPSARAVSYLQEKMLRNAARYSKDIIRSKILDLIRKHRQISALQLREMIVDEMGLCSRSTFYRVLEELGKDKESELSAVLRKRMKIFLAPEQAVRETDD